MDPHKRSATIKFKDADEDVLCGGRFGTDAAGFALEKTYPEQWPERVLASLDSTAPMPWFSSRAMPVL